MRGIIRHSTLVGVLEAHVLSSLITVDLETAWPALRLRLIVMEDVTFLLVLVVNLLNNHVSLNYVAVLPVHG